MNDDIDRILEALEELDEDLDRVIYQEPLEDTLKFDQPNKADNSTY